MNRLSKNWYKILTDQGAGDFRMKFKMEEGQKVIRGHVGGRLLFV